MKKIVLFLLIVLLYGSCTTEPVPGSGSVLPRSVSKKVRQTKRSKTNKQISAGVSAKRLTGPQIFAKYKNAVFIIVVSDGTENIQGSGFFVNSDGLGVSNYHVFNSYSKGNEQIKLGNNYYKVSRVVAQSQEEDWVLFEVYGGGRSFSYIPIGRKNPKVGSIVYALGSPRGLENTFSSGEISQIRSNGKILQISVPIDHGSSGGALIDEYGYVVGITSAGIDDSGANLNFAYSIQLLRDYLK